MRTQDPDYEKWLSKLDGLHSTVGILGDVKSPGYSTPEASAKYDFHKLYSSPHRDKLIKESKNALGNYAMPEGFERTPDAHVVGMASGTTQAGLAFVSMGADGEDQSLKGAGEVWRDFSGWTAVPFAAGVHEGAEIADIWAAARDLEKNDAAASPESFKIVNKFLQDAQRERTFMGGFLEIVLQLPAFAIEFMTTGGLATAGRKGAAKIAGASIRELLERRLGQNVVSKGLAAVASGAVHTGTMAAAMTPRVAASTYRRALPGMASMQDGERAAIIFDETSKEFLEALPAGYMDMWIEVLSEKSGEAMVAGMRKLPLVNKLNIMQGSLFSRWKKMNPTRTTRDFLDEIAGQAGWAKTLKSMGVQGPVTEMMEERVGDAMRTAILGDEWDWPSAKQMAQELSAFSVIPGLTAIPLRRQQTRMLKRLEDQADSEEGLSQNIQEVFEGKEPLDPPDPTDPTDPTGPAGPSGPSDPSGPTGPQVVSVAGDIDGKDARVTQNDDGSFTLEYADDRSATSIELDFGEMPDGGGMEAAVTFAEEQFSFNRKSRELGADEVEKDTDLPDRTGRDLEEVDGEFVVIEEDPDVDLPPTQEFEADGETPVPRVDDLTFELLDKISGTIDGKVAHITRNRNGSVTLSYTKGGRRRTENTGRHTQVYIEEVAENARASHGFIRTTPRQKVWDEDGNEREPIYDENDFVIGVKPLKREPNQEGGATAEEIMDADGVAGGNITPEEANFGFKTAALEIEALNEAEPEPADRKKTLKLYDALTQAMVRGTRDFQSLMDEADSRGFGNEVRDAIRAYAQGVSEYRQAQKFKIVKLTDPKGKKLFSKLSKKQAQQLQDLGIKDPITLNASTTVIHNDDGVIVAATSGSSLHVHPDFQQMGLGSKLIEYLKGNREITSIVATTRHAVKFLSDRGFTADGKWVSGEGQKMVFKRRKDGESSDLAEELEAESKIDPKVVADLMEEHDISEESAVVAAKAPEGEKAYLTRDQVIEASSAEGLEIWEIMFDLEHDAKFGYDYVQVAGLLESEGGTVPTPHYAGPSSDAVEPQESDDIWEDDKPSGEDATGDFPSVDLGEGPSVISEGDSLTERLRQQRQHRILDDEALDLGYPSHDFVREMLPSPGVVEEFPVHGGDFNRQRADIKRWQAKHIAKDQLVEREFVEIPSWGVGTFGPFTVFKMNDGRLVYETEEESGKVVMWELDPADPKLVLTAPEKLGDTEDAKSGEEAVEVDERGLLRPFGYEVDNPGGGWLEVEQKASRENPERTGAVTASTRNVPMLVSDLDQLEGENDEHLRRETEFSQRKVGELQESMEESGYRESEAPLVWVRPGGRVTLAEGNHRVQAAKAAGIKVVPVQVRWFAGAEDIPGDYSAKSIAGRLPQPEPIPEASPPKPEAEVELSTSEGDNKADLIRDILRDINDLNRETGFGGGTNDPNLKGSPSQEGRLDPEIVKKIVTLAERLVSAGITDFDQFVDIFSEHMGKEAIPYLSPAWTATYRKADKAVRETMTSPAEARKVNIQERRDAKSEVGSRGGGSETVLGESVGRGGGDPEGLQGETNVPSIGDDPGVERSDPLLDEPAAGEPSVDDRGTERDGGDGSSVESAATERGAAEGEREAVTAAEDRAERFRGLDRGRVSELARAGSELVNYEPASKAKSNGLKMPGRLARATHRAVKKIESETGVPIDEWVTARIGANDVTKFLYAEQVDAVALSIHAIENGKGLIIGDGTGTGKGRIAAAIARYALHNGYVPVWFTQGAKLYKTASRDLADVEASGLSIMSTNNDMSMELDGAFGQAKLQSGNQKQALEVATKKLIALAPLPADASREQRKLHGRKLKSILGADVVLSTYVQVDPKASSKTRRDFISALAPHAILIMDESHNAAGGGGPAKQEKARGQSFSMDKDHTKESFRRFIGASHGGIFLSATWAKGPHSLGLYMNTPLGVYGAHLGYLIESGGLPLLQSVSASLASSGSMIRRQSSMDGATYETVVMEGFRDAADEVSDILATIMSLDSEHKDSKKRLAGRWSTSLMNIAEAHNLQAGSALGMDYETMTPYRPKSEIKPTQQLGLSSYLHSIMQTLMLSMKADEISEQAVKAIKAGFKPIIAIQNTGSAILDKHIDLEGLKVGDEVGEFGVRQALMAQLHRSRTLRVNAPVGPEEIITLTEEAPQIEIEERKGIAQTVYLTDDMLRRNEMVNFLSDWEEAKRLIEGADLSKMSGSPLDRIIEKLEEAGIRVGEATGRDRGVRDGKLTRIKTDTNIQAGLISSFNGDRVEATIDVLLVNQSAATGLDMHAGNKFNDTTPRIMLVAQMYDDVNILSQVLGRIHRNNQAHEGTYNFLISDVPVEKRYMSQTSKRLAELNSTSTAEEGGEFDLSLDLINHAGDIVTDAWLRANPLLRSRMGLPTPSVSGKYGTPEVPGGIAKKVFLRMALLRTKDQLSLIDDLEENYIALLEAQAAMGSVITGAQQMDLNAVTNKVDVLIPAAEEGATDHNSGPTYIESVTVDRLFIPVDRDAVEAMYSPLVTSNLGLALASQKIPRLKALKDKWLDLTDEIEGRVASRVERARASHRKAVEAAEAADERPPVFVWPGKLKSEADALDSAKLASDNAGQAISRMESLISQVASSGGYLNITRGGETRVGRVLAVTDKGTSENPEALSRYDISIYTSDGPMHISGAAFGLSSGPHQMGGEFTLSIKAGLKATFENSLQASTSKTEERHIITGNLPQARMLFGNLGKVIEYTSVEGGKTGDDTLRASSVESPHKVYRSKGIWFIKGFNFQFPSERDAQDFSAEGVAAPEDLDYGMGTVNVNGKVFWILMGIPESFPSRNEAIAWAYRKIQESRLTKDSSPERVVLRAGQLLPRSTRNLNFITNLE